MNNKNPQIFSSAMKIHSSESLTVCIDILSNIPGYVIAFNSERELIFWSKKCEQKTGFYLSSDLHFSSILKKIFPDSFYRERVLKEFVESSENISDFETQFLDIDENILSFLWSSFQTNYNKESNVFCFLGEDITEKKSIRKSLLSNENQLKIAQDIADIGNWEWELSTGNITWSNVMYRIFGYNDFNSNITIKDIYKYSIHDADKKAVTKQLKVLFSEKTNFFIEFRILTDSKSIRILSIQADVILNKEKEIIKIFGTCKDVTDFKNVELELHKVRGILEKSQKIAGMGSWQYNYTEDELFVSAGFYEMFGISKSEFSGISETVCSKILETDKESFTNFYKNTSQNRVPDEIHFFIITDEKVKRKIEASCFFEENRSGQFLHGIFRDITFQSIAEEKLKDAKLRAEESDRLKSAFLANMSHEIRTPMNAIIGFSSLLAESNLNDEQRLLYLNYINISSENLLNLINDIIDLAKIESGQIVISKSYFSLNMLLEEVFYTGFDFRTSISRTNVFYLPEYDHFDNDFHIYTDRKRIKQILDNLINNALKFTHSGQVSFRCSVNENLLLFSVHDTGIGISEEHTEKIFSRFFKVFKNDNDQLYSGTGLGLAICKRLSGLLDGRIWMESEYGKGSIFYVEIPFKHPDYDHVVVQDTLIESVESFYWKDKTVLIAEDDNSNFVFIQSLLSSTEINIIHAINGEQVVDLFIRNKVDLILMDIRMPIIDGITATNKIKQINSKVPIIAQTAFGMQDDELNYLRKGFDDYVSKPLNKEKFLNKLRLYLKK